MTQNEQLEQRFIRQEHELHVHQAELEQQNEELRQINLELELAHARYADLFEFAPVGYVVCDLDGLIVQINRTGCTQLGSDLAHLVGRPFALFVQGSQRGVFAELLSQLLQAPEAQHAQCGAELQMATQDGRSWDAQLSCTAVAGSHRQLVRVVVTDVSALKVALRETEQRTAQVELLSTELQSFVRAMTHDLTRPLRQVVGFAEALGQSLQASDERSARHLHHLLMAASDMGALTSALIQFVQNAGPGGVPQPVDLNRVLDDLVRELGPVFAGRQVAITHGPLPVLWSDEQQLRTVFGELLENAVKFTGLRPDARIHVEVQSTATHHLLSVHDNGVGFDTRQAQRLFTVFGRLHSDRQFRGQGLGLAMVRRMVQRLQGEVWGESGDGPGAVFRVLLPRHPEAATAGELEGEP